MMEEVTLESVCNKITDGSHNPPKGKDSGMLMLSSRNIFNEGLDLKSVRYISSEEFEFENRRTDITNGDVLMTIVGTIGRVLVVDSLCPKFTLQRSVGVLKPKANLISSKYLAYTLKSPSFQRKLIKGARGVAQKGIYLKDIRKLKIPLPPLPEQKRIANILDQADQLCQLNQQILAQYDALTKSLFLDMFGDPVGNNKKFPKQKLGKLGKWQTGGTPSRRKLHYYQGSIPWLSSGELEQLFINDSKEHISELAINESAAKILETGSLLLGMYDTAALKSTISTAPLSCNQAIASAKLDDNKVNTIYVYFLIQIGKEHFKRLQRGVRQKNLNLSIVKNIEIIMPPLNLQNQFAQKIKNIEAQKATAKTALEESENLFNCLLQKAFKGDL